MRVRHTVHFKKPIRVVDHWPVRALGGTLTLLSEGELVHGLEIVHAAKPTSYAPSIERKDGPIKAQITARDPLAIELQARARRAFAYLQCFFNIEIDADRLTSTYEAETPEEDDHIDIKGYKFEKSEQPLSLTYDYIVRSLWATDEDADPEFVAKLAATARRAFFEEEYISSFRYSFLLIDSLYGRGKFQSYQLKKELSGERSVSADGRKGANKLRGS